ncbi:nucleotidyltransferase domain-containing protein [Candidatus Pacearchaeota archaeon]|nr:nucleotidyltransferase domain-containing protein [Candidatus Pacearchaeota archaeon]
MKMRIKQKQIKLIESILKEIYEKYKDRGILSIYLWGSILTEDFNPKSSDIDSIAIVNEKSKIKDNKKINNFLKSRFPGIDFKLNYLYLDELNGGKVKSRLAKVIAPNLLLLDFKTWRLVTGKNYSREDFKLKKIDFDKAVRLNLDAANKNHLPLFKRGDFSITPYFIKNLMKVCHYLNQKDIGEHVFMYKELLRKSPKKRKKIVKLLLKIRKDNWDKSLTKKNLPLLIEFMNVIK